MTFHRINDPSHECRELLLYQDGSHFSIWEAIGFLENKDFCQRKQIHIGWESEMKTQFAEEAKRLREEGFTICDPSPKDNNKRN